MAANEYLLRLAGPGDEDEIHQLLCIPLVYRYLADGVEPPRAIAREWMETSADDFVRCRGGLWAMICIAENSISGLARLSDFTDGELQLTYLLDPRKWGHGHALRMSHTAICIAFEAGEAASVWAGADTANLASVAVMKNLGMKFRRHVDYPAGPGVEYFIRAPEFDRRRVDLLPVA